MDAHIRTNTDAQSERSSGGPHDFYSEGDYWWPDAANPEVPYVRRDGMTNPDIFLDHQLNPDSDKNEIIRNHFIRQPVLWVWE